MGRGKLTWLLFLQLPLFSGLIAAEVPAVIVFGDSSVDAGNNNAIPTIARSNFSPYGQDFEGGRPTGRFCNGRIATDFISEAFGIKKTIPAYLDPQYSIKDFSTGVCFASAGTGYDNVTARVASVIPLWRELELFKDYRRKLMNYLGNNEAEKTLREAVYMMSIGTNDFIENYYTSPVRSSQFTIQEYEDFLIGIAENFIVELYRLGGRKISLGGIPPMGCLPLERTTNFNSPGGCREDYNIIAREFNEKLQGLVAKLRNKLAGIQLVFSDVYGIMLQAIEKPYSYGFENVRLGCCGSGTFEMGFYCDQSNPLTCPDANKYMFWDSIHPTEKMNRLVADHVMKTSFAEFV